MLLDDEDAFQALGAALRDEPAPDSPLQEVLAARVTPAAWRLRRAERMEVELLDRTSARCRGDRALSASP